jgi:predicted esterase
MRVILLLLLVLPSLAAEPKRIELGFPQLQERVEVVFPENYDESRTWPAVFYYHGTGQTPDTRLIRHHTGDQDWFVIGMGYVQQGEFTMTPESVADELQILKSVRRHLAGKYKLDPKRCYLAGFSKGGWMSGILLQADRSFAGAAILGAGHHYKVSSRPARFSKNHAVFVGVGRQDGNYPLGLRAVTWYRGLGASATLETWHDLGHAFPQTGSPALTQWLAIQADPGGEHRKEALAWATQRLKKIDAIRDPVNRWVALRDAESAPYAKYLPDATKALLRSKRTKLEQTAVVSVEAKALAAHRKILLVEVKEPTRTTYEKASAAYYKLSQNNPNTRQGEVALADHKRVKDLLVHLDAEEAKEKETPAPEPADKPVDPSNKGPDPRPRIPGNPLIR